MRCPFDFNDKLGFNYAFPSGEGGNRRLTDEENTVCENNGLSQPNFVC